MESSIMSNASRFLREQKKKRKWQKVLACLALVVAAGTTIALIMPGQALNNTEKVLDCQIEVHQHTADCYGEDGTTLICGLADYVAHTHNELCYNEEGELICKLPEMPAHQHTADCYAEERVLTCGLEETPEDGEGIPVSGGDQENAVPHVHTDECYTTVSHLICGQLEAVEHVHTDACFKEVTVDGEETDENSADAEFTDVSAGDLAAARDEWYFCGKKAHTHSDECYDALGDVICGQEEHEHTEECLKEEAVYACGMEEHTHDDACYDADGNLICGLEEHVHEKDCLVVYWCKLITHTHNIACYDTDGNVICGMEEHQHTEECLIAPILERVYEDEFIRVTASYPATADIPEEAQFNVKYLSEFSQGYDDYIEEAEKIMNEKPSVFAFLDIGFYGEDGIEITPKEPVTINVQFLEAYGSVSDDPLVVIHFADTGAEVMDSSSTDNNESTEFVTDDFSPYLFGTLGGDPTEIDIFDEAIQNYSPAIHKQIDYLGDNNGNGGDKDNPYTDEDDKTDNRYADDLYRLSLDITGSEAKRPVDLLIVLDLSSSMASINPAAQDDPTYRDEKIWEVLNGKDRNTQGLIEKFLNVNQSIEDSEDKSLVSVVWYAGRIAYAGGTNWRDLELDNWGPFHQGVVNGNGVNQLQYTESGVVIPWTDSYAGWKEESFYNSYNKNDPVNSSSKSRFQAKYFYMNSWLKLSTTNYVAGMVRADYMLRDSKAANNGHKKIVMFLSDGLPTHYYLASDMQDDEIWDNPTGAKANSLTRYGAGADQRVYSDIEGDGVDNGSNFLISRYLNLGNERATEKTFTDMPGDDAPKASPYIKETLGVFEKFHERNPDIQFYSVGIDLDESVIDDVNGKDRFKRYYTLQQMANMYGTQMLSIDSGDAADAITDQFEQILFPNKVNITDQLSQYVELYDDELNNTADVLVTAENIKTGKVQYLWSGYNDAGTGSGTVMINNQPQTLNNWIDGMQVVDKVTVDGKKVSVKFVDEYYLSSHYTYTLSFNVKLTDAAYDYYAQNHNYPNQGDDDTDYNENKTSSNKKGLFSNKDATVTYTVGGTPGSKKYPDPVVQVWRSKLVIEKRDQYEEAVEDAQFKLTRTDKNGTGTPTQVIPSKYGKKIGDYYTPKAGTIEYDKLPTGTYTLEEVAPSGYGKVNDTITFKVEDGRILKSSTSNKPESGTSKYSYTWSGELWDEDDPGASRNYTNREYGDEVSLTITNDRLEAPIRIVKQDTAGNNVFGVEFKLYSKDSTATPIATGTSDGDGNVSWEISGFGTKYCHFKDASDHKSLYLRKGSYELEEVSTPEGYNKLDGRISFEMIQDGDSLKLAGTDDTVDASDPNDRQLWRFDVDSGMITVVNKLNYVKLKLLKKGNVDPEYAGKDAMSADGILTAAGLVGAKFEIHEAKGTDDGPLVATGTTADKTGSILWKLESAYQMGSDSNSEVSELSLPLGNYYLEEVEAPIGYKQIESKLYFDVKLDPSGKMIIASNEEKNGTDVLPWEISIPDDTVTGIITITVTDEPLELKLSAEKKDPLEVALPGAEFAVYKDDSGKPDVEHPIAKGESDENGKIKWTLESGDDRTEKDVLLLVPGHYYIKETQPPVDGEFKYKGLGDDMIEFEVKIDPTAEGGLVVNCAEDEAKPARWTFTTAGTGADLALNLTVKNVQQFINLQIVKYGDSYTAATTDEKVPLENAYFKLFKLTSGDDTYGTESASWSEVTLGGNIRSGKDGIVRFTDGLGNENSCLKLSYGYYYLQETEAPLGYNIIKAPIYFQIGPDDTTGLGKITIMNSGDFGSDVVSVGDRNDKLFIEMVVTDNMGAELPETGGFGVYPYMLGGLALALVAIIALMYKKRSITN